MDNHHKFSTFIVNVQSLSLHSATFFERTITRNNFKNPQSKKKKIGNSSGNGYDLSIDDGKIVRIQEGESRKHHLSDHPNKHPNEHQTGDNDETQQTLICTQSSLLNSRQQRSTK
jgi:hypothetical protein